MNIQEIMNQSEFYETETGGGCTAYMYKDADNGHEILITQSGDPSMPTDINQECTVGLYDSNGNELMVWEVSSIFEALHAAKWYVMEYYQEQESI